MISILKKSAVAAALLGSCVVAFAAPSPVIIGQNSYYDFGTLNDSKGATVVGSPDGFTGSFDNVFSFSLPSAGKVEAGISGLDVYGDMLAAYRVGTGAVGHVTWSSALPTFAPVPQNPNTGDIGLTKTMSGLSKNTTYWIEIAGTASQGYYSLTLAPTLAPVPEPESWAMLLAGLGAMGAIARRRRTTSV